MRDNSLVNPKIYFETLNELINIDPTLGRVSMGIFCIDNVDTIKMMYDRYKDRCDLCIVDNERTIEALRAFFGENTEGVTYIIYEKDEELESEENFWKNMKLDYIIMNPPFNNANKIWDKAREHSSQPVVCLGPLSMYKGNNRCKYIDTLVKVDPKLFVDASITDNLCLTTSTNIPNNKVYSDYEFLTYDENYMDYYMVIKESPKTCEVIHDPSTKREIDVSRTFATNFRVCDHGVHGSDAWDWKWNMEREASLPTMESISGKSHYNCLIVILSSIKAHSNFCKWWWYNNGNNLADRSIKGLHKNNGTCKDAIPQIDWETISDHPLWIEGRYDEAVLDTMGLKWNETMTGVVKK